MPSSLEVVPEAAKTWQDLADMVTNDAVPFVHLPLEDMRDLGLLTNLGGATVVPGPNGRDVTLLVKEHAPATDDQPAVKKAAAAPSKFAADDEPERRE
jgi:hypothetical protein